MTLFEKTKNFVYRNARPLDLALWKYHFENGSANEVLKILSFYQNEDGGFAYALEPDNWNTNSNPVATWAATQRLYEIDFCDREHPIIKGILRYLASGKDFENGKWYNTVAGNNSFPHAIWWECPNDKGVPDDNPTVSLAGFILRFADKDSEIYKTAEKISVKAVDEFMDKQEIEMHTARCYLDLLNYCLEIDGFDLFDVEAYRKNLIEKVEAVICKDTEKWAADYVCTPSMFFERKMTVLGAFDKSLVKAECNLIESTQLDDGSFPVTWQWHNDYKEFEIAANWWKSGIAIKNMLYLKHCK